MDVERFRNIVNTALPTAYKVALPRQYLADDDIARESTGPMCAGDASLHLGWTLPRANPSRIDQDREVMTVVRFADGARVGEPAHDGQKLDRLVWLCNIEPGELAASDLNRLVGVS